MQTARLIASCSGRARPSVAAGRSRASVTTRAGLFGLPIPLRVGRDRDEEREQRKEELLDLIEPLNRGLNISEEEMMEVEEAAQALEALNPTRSPLNSELLNGQWLLLYTTSRTILGTLKPPIFRPWGPIYQVLDNRSLRARNRETAPFFNQVSANLEPISDSRTEVVFDQFLIFGIIPIRAPPSAKGELEITYLDEDLRISRGNRDNLFILRLDDPDIRPDA